MKIALYLKQLDHCLESLKTADEGRNVRIENVQNQIRGMIMAQEIGKLDKREALVKLDNIAPMVNRLAAEPTWDGQPETLPPPASGTVEVELGKGPDTERSPH